MPRPTEHLAPEIEWFLTLKDRRDGKVRLQHPDRLPLCDQLPDPLKEAAWQLRRIADSLNPVELYTADPDSLQTEKERFLTAFLEGKEYHPVFRYSYAADLDAMVYRPILDQLLTMVRTYKPLNDTERLARSALLLNIIDAFASLDLAEGLKNRDEETIQHALYRKYPSIDAYLLLLAEREYERRIGPEEEDDEGVLSVEEKHFFTETEMNAEAIRDAFAYQAERYGILSAAPNDQGFQVVIDDRATDIDVRDKSSRGNIIVVPANRRDTMARILAICAHEVDGHARQAINGRKLVGLGRSDDETLYEGLALRLEDRFMHRYFGKRVHPRFGYVFAIHLAEQGASFHEIFQDQLERELHVRLHAPLDAPVPPLRSIDEQIRQKTLWSAWKTTYRVMRGHIDMENRRAFAMPKDAAYLRGFYLDKQLQQQGLAHLNEADIVATKGLHLLAKIHLRQEDLPLPFLDTAAELLEKMRPGAA